ncbi:MAG: hypothetical protein DYG89_14525 [Caldilinea sp. CFX5]|nr:hypothetical protein [Caldilinea sp. CFX5]
MSEYQYYEFRTINRQLTPAERTAVNKLSSHGHTTATSFSVDYSYGNFKHDPNQVLARYFDLFFYMANWGTVMLKFRYPKGLLDLRRLEPYCLDGTMVIDHQTVDDSVIVGFDWNPEDSTDWIEADGLVDGVAGLYHEIMGGDYRAFYLAWLRAIQNGADYSGEVEEDTLEPPVPPGLDSLSPALTDFMALFEIDKDLVAAAAKGSGAAATPTVDIATALAALSKEECIAFLERFLQGEAHLDLKLKQRIGLLQPASAEYDPSGARTVDELLAARDEVVQRRRQAAAAAKEAKRRAELAALAPRSEQAWQEVETFIEQKTADGYKQAISLLQQLGDLAREQGQGTTFASRIEQLRTRYSRRSAFIRELQRVKV